MAIRAVVVDIDGTMTDYQRRLDWAGVRAVRTLEAHGVPVMTASGNVAPVTRSFNHFVGASGPAVCENGGVVHAPNFRAKKVLASRRHADRAVARLRRLGFPARYLWSDPWRESEVALELNLDEAAVRQALSGWRLNIVSTKFALHLMEPGLNKMRGVQTALRWMPARRPIRPQSLLAVGDSDNDVEMLEGCGSSGAVANATPAAKRAAQYVAGRRHGAGVEEIFRHFGAF